MFEDIYLNTLYKALHGLRSRNVMTWHAVQSLIEPEPETWTNNVSDEWHLNFVHFLRSDLVFEAFDQLFAYQLSHNES